jgi:hypothetical protein
VGERTFTINPNYANAGLVVTGVYRGQLSPFDVPERATSTYDAARKQLRIRFEYLTPEEPRIEKRFQGDLSLWIGKRSSKLYEVVLERVDLDTVPEVRVRIVAAIDDLRKAMPAREPKNAVGILNLVLAEELFKKEPQLLAVGAQ